MAKSKGAKWINRVAGWKGNDPGEARAQILKVDEIYGEAVKEFPGLEDFRFHVNHRPKTRAGMCVFNPSNPLRQRVELSGWIFGGGREWSKIVDTLLHEVAHALAGNKAAHGPKWKAKAEEVGAEPTRCFNSVAEGANPPARRYAGVCVKGCDGVEHKRHRLRVGTMATGVCEVCDAPLVWTLHGEPVPEPKATDVPEKWADFVKDRTRRLREIRKAG